MATGEPVTPQEAEKTQIDPVYRAQLTRTISAFLEARGEEVVQKRTPEYLTGGALLLKKTFGPHLASYMCRLDDTRRFNRWLKSVDLPATYEQVGLLSAIEIAETLLSKLSARNAKEWMVTPCRYLSDELPLDLIRSEPELVRRAALQLHL